MDIAAKQCASVTNLLVRWRAGEHDCLDRLIPHVKEELQRIARRYMRGERPGHTFQTTALVNEAYLRLIAQSQMTWQNRAHFGVAARLMRHILLDHARGSRHQKGGESATCHLPLDEGLVFSPRNRRS